MARKLHMLACGINEYPAGVSNLAGCVNDVKAVTQYVTDNFKHLDIRLETLFNHDVTRQNVIDQFRQHLGQAEKGDIVFFQYCGHGARSKSAPEWKEYYPDGWDEGLVCYDSRQPGGFDLADKEIAVLLHELHQKGAHINVLLDNCHSGSATRNLDDFVNQVHRQTYKRSDPRPLESYIDGYYAQQGMHIPAARHISLAACQRDQKAWEWKGNHGVFTATLIEALERGGHDVSYADLFMKTRQLVKKRAENQDPQFETYEFFSGNTKFLEGTAVGERRRFLVYFESNKWKVEAGALHGLPTNAATPAAFALYPEDAQASTEALGHVSTRAVGAQKSTLQAPDFAADKDGRYLAEITSLPVPPYPIYFEGEALAREQVEKHLNEATPLALTDTAEGTHYSLSVKDEQYSLVRQQNQLLIQGAKGINFEAASHMVDHMRKVVNWENTLALQNQSTQFADDAVDFQFFEMAANGKDLPYPGNSVQLDITRDDAGKWRKVRFKLAARNNTQQELHVALLYFSEKYGINILKNDPLPPAPTG